MIRALALALALAGCAGSPNLSHVGEVTCNLPAVGNWPASQVFTNTVKACRDVGGSAAGFVKK